MDIRKILLLLLWVAVLPALFFSCKNDDGESSSGAPFDITLDVDGDYVFPDIPGAAKLTITTSGDWKITPSHYWIDANPKSGSGNGEIEISIGVNNGLSYREGVVVVSVGGNSKSATIKQDGTDFYLESEDILLTSRGTTQSLRIMSRYDWEITSEIPENFTINPLKGSGLDGEEARAAGNEILTISAEKNETGEKIGPHQIEITLKGKEGDNIRSFSLSQKAEYFYTDGEVVNYQNSSMAGANPVRLIVTGDGFVDSDYEEDGNFDEAVKTAIEAMFSIEPYKSYRNYFQIDKVVAISEESGATVLNDFKGSGTPDKQEKNTIFGSTFTGGSSTAINMNNENMNSVFSYAKKAGLEEEELDDAAVLVIINLDVEAGTCHIFYSGRSISLCPAGSTFSQIVMHEFGGHGFGRLYDEYTQNFVAITETRLDSVRKYRQELVGEKYVEDPWKFAANVSFTDNRGEVHWSHYFSLPKYGKTVGLYEGAALYSIGAWRPEYNSCMLYNIAYYNAPSREAIVRRVVKVAGEEFDIEAFYEKDVHNPPAHSRTAEESTRYAPPVLIYNGP